MSLSRMLALVALSTLGFCLAQPLPTGMRDTISRAVVSLEPFNPKTGDFVDFGGSGTIVSPSGYIVTNHHVIADDKTGTIYKEQAVMVTEGSLSATQEIRFRYWARYVAGNAALDIAILKIRGKADRSPLAPGASFPYLPVADSLQMQPLDEVIVVGYPGSSGDLLTFTRGIVSGWSNEDLDGAGKAWLRTDAEIDSGNSGGAALNAKGELIGVPTACFYVGDEGEEVCVVRPTHLMFGLVAWNVFDLQRAGSFTETDPAFAPYPVGPTASGPYGHLKLGEMATGVIAGSPEKGPTVYHLYTLALPRGRTRVTVSVDGLGKDIDVAVKLGKTFSDLKEFSDARIFDTSKAKLHTHILKGLTARTVHIAVVNLLDTSVQYELRAK